MRVSVNPIFDMIGYDPKTTFWEDFSIADAFGVKAIKDTFNNAFKYWKDNYEYLTELVMVLNHKSWQYADNNPDFSKLYVDLYYKADDWALKHLKGEELSYFLRTTD